MEETIDVVRLDATHSVTVGLDDYSPEYGEVRTPSTSNDNRQRKYGYRVKYTVLKECTGFWEGGPSSRINRNGATLVVIKIQPKIDNSIENWFKTLKVKLEIAFDRDASGKKIMIVDDVDKKIPASENKLGLQHYAPAKHDAVAAAEAKRTREQVQAKNLGMQGGAPSGFFTATAGVNWEDRVSYDVLRFLKVTSDTYRSREIREEDTAAEWTVTAIDEGYGTGDSMTVAILVRHRPGATFALLADTEGHLGKINDTLERLARKRVVCITGFGTRNATDKTYAATADAVPIDKNNMHTLEVPGKIGTALDVLVGGSGITLPHVDKPTSGPAAVATALPQLEAQAPLPQLEAQAPLPQLEAQAPLPQLEAQAPLPQLEAQAPLPQLEAQAPPPPQPETQALPLPVNPLLQRGANELTASAMPPPLVVASAPQPPSAVGGMDSRAAGTVGPQFWDARARRHRNMAILYEKLAKLHREEADEARGLADAAFVRGVDGEME